MCGQVCWREVGASSMEGDVVLVDQPLPLLPSQSGVVRVSVLLIIGGSLLRFALAGLCSPQSALCFLGA
jgi:hypothetical protein